MSYPHPDDWDAMFGSSDPWERYAAHQAAKGNTQVRGAGPPPRDGGNPSSQAVVGPSAPQLAGPPPPRDTHKETP